MSEVVFPCVKLQWSQAHDELPQQLGEVIPQESPNPFAAAGPVCQLLHVCGDIMGPDHMILQGCVRQPGPTWYHYGEMLHWLSFKDSVRMEDS